MSKSILVIDTPSTCADCPLSRWAGIEPVNSMTYLRCYAMHKVMCLVDEGKVLVDICPLKPMPAPMPYEQTDTQTVKAIKIDNCFRAGWNKCIEELEK